MNGLSERDVVLLAALLDRHVTDAAFESGCRLSCGYDGDDLTRHMAEAVLASDWLAERDAAIRDEAKAEALAPIRALAEKWSGCWCGTQMAHDHDPRVQDCPQHGDSSCQHMAEGITVDLRALLDGGDQ